MNTSTKKHKICWEASITNALAFKPAGKTAVAYGAVAYGAETAASERGRQGKAAAAYGAETPEVGTRRARGLVVWVRVTAATGGSGGIGMSGVKP
ncbi:hypothetical protein E2562_032400 [Oryza meyeriana var. granulata]|uniref:Uncharacterized protein n=1 Tax=Oryza meyeriana var. granulata TaxID=110450 RepID=A0A6G1CVF5_9ORYZ|nr:hypothetical protein E2562_032400 [Oryza meyeriana var. granulata]